MSQFTNALSYVDIDNLHHEDGKSNEIKNEEMIVTVNAIYAIVKRSLEKKIQDFSGVWTHDLAITGAMLYQLSYEATDVGSRSVVGSYVPVKEMNTPMKFFSYSCCNCI